MTHKLIKTDNYLLVGADDDLKRGWFYCVRTKSIFQDEGEDIHCCIGDIRIIAHLPLNNSPYLGGVDVLPPLEDDIEKLAIEEVGIDGQIYNISDNESFIKGYYKAKEKYKYTEEDLKLAMNWLFETKGRKGFEDLIERLNQPSRPTHFECEMENCDKCVYVQGGNLSPDCCNQLKPKTTTNSQGLTEWMGEYKF